MNETRLKFDRIKGRCGTEEGGGGSDAVSIDSGMSTDLLQSLRTRVCKAYVSDVW